MVFYKIIRDESVIDAGFVFLKWNEKRHRMYICDVDEGQFVQSFKGDTIYTAEWLKPAPAEAGTYETVQVVVIDAAEYDELKAYLEDGEDVPVIPVPPEPEPEPEPEPDDEPEHQMTVAEMRQHIVEQDEQIALLTECILEMSEVIYDG